MRDSSLRSLICRALSDPVSAQGPSVSDKIDTLYTCCSHDFIDRHTDASSVTGFVDGLCLYGSEPDSDDLDCYVARYSQFRDWSRMESGLFIHQIGTECGFVVDLKRTIH